MNVVELRGITKTFQAGTPGELTVLHGLDVDIAQGEFLSIVGVSGSGKSTLMNVIGLLDRLTTGTYLLDGEDVLAADANELARIRSTTIGFVFQNFNLIPRMSAQRNVEVPLMYAGIGRKERADRSAELLTLVGMGERMGHDPSQFLAGNANELPSPGH